MTFSQSSLMDEKSIDQNFVRQHLPMVHSIARKIRERVRQVDYDDLVAFGLQGLLEANQRYNQYQGTTFSTFAYYRIKGAILDGIRVMTRGNTILRFEEAAAAYLETKPIESANIEEENRLHKNFSSFAETLQELSTIFISAASKETSEPTTSLEKRNLQKRVRMGLQSLIPKERQLIEMHYFEDFSLVEIAERLSMSKSWVSRTHQRAITNLKTILYQLRDENI